MIATCWLADCQAVKKPLRPGVAISDRYTDTPPSSAPAEKPCSKRPISTSAGANRPMDSYPGTSTINIVPLAMIDRVTIKPLRRPTSSMYAPSTIAPSGRIKKPAPNTANVIIREANSLLAGKNTAAICVA